jgi:hypothetical protein
MAADNDDLSRGPHPEGSNCGRRWRLVVSSYSGGPCYGVACRSRRASAPFAKPDKTPKKFRELTMNTSMLAALGAISLLTLAGCNKAEAPAKVESDVAKASHSAAENDIKAEAKEASVEAGTRNDVATAEQNADAKNADASADADVTRAEGVKSVAIEKCEALSGDSQRACKDKATAALDMARANAKAMKASH